MMTSAFLGHSTTRGTLMFLKRLFVTVLGACGLGALLAVGPALAQDPMPDGQIPAPRLFDDIAKCQGTARTPQGSAMRGQTQSPLEIIVEGATGSPISRVSADADIDTTQETQLLTRLMFPTGVDDCMNPLTGAYDRAIDFYNDYISARDALPREDDDPDEESNLERAARLARADKEAFGGDVFDKVYDVLMKEEDVEDAIEDYNDLVGTDGRLAALTTAYNAISVTDFVDDAGTALTADALERLFGEDEIQGFQAIDTTDSADANNDGFHDITRALILSDTADGTITTLGAIATELQTRQTTLDTAEKNLADAKEADRVDLTTLQQAVNEAKAARDHVKSEQDRLTAILRAHNFEYAEAARITIGSGDDEVVLARDHRQVLSGFASINNQVDKAAMDLETAVKALDSANAAARNAFGDANSYLNQLVSMREFNEDKAEAARDEDGPNPAPSLVADFEDAEKLRMEAEALRSTYRELVGDTENPNPANRLLSALLASEDPMTDALEDDDGKALIDAVAAIHESTADNKGEIDTLKNQLTDADGNPIDLTNLGDTEAVTKNANDIAALTADTDDGDASDGPITANTKAIVSIEEDLYGTTSSQHGDVCASPSGLIGVANCADARSRHNADDINDPTPDSVRLTTSSWPRRNTSKTSRNISA